MKVDKIPLPLRNFQPQTKRKPAITFSRVKSIPLQVHPQICELLLIKVRISLSSSACAIQFSHSSYSVTTLARSPLAKGTVLTSSLDSRENSSCFSVSLFRGARGSVFETTRARALPACMYNGPVVRSGEARGKSAFAR